MILNIFLLLQFKVESEEGISNRNIKNLIKDIIDEENKLKPLSDEEYVKS